MTSPTATTTRSTWWASASLWVARCSIPSRASNAGDSVTAAGSLSLVRRRPIRRSRWRWTPSQHSDVSHSSTLDYCLKSIEPRYWLEIIFSRVYCHNIMLHSAHLGSLYIVSTVCEKICTTASSLGTVKPLQVDSASVYKVLWRCWLGGRKGIRPVKNWVVRCWRGYLSGTRCRLAHGPADATATHCLLLQ